MTISLTFRSRLSVGTRGLLPNNSLQTDASSRRGLTQVLDAMVILIATSFLVMASGTAIACGCNMPESTDCLPPNAIVFGGEAGPTKA